MKLPRSKKRIALIVLLLGLLILSLISFPAQRFWAHRTGYFIPDYPRVALKKDSDYETIFLQTGLGRSAVDKLVSEDKFEVILAAQDSFFHPPQARCTPLLGWFTREDRFTEGSGTPLQDLQPGDILLTLSTHSAGWRHGHAGLVMDGNTTLECVVWGTDSTLMRIDHWNTYSNYAVLRPKEVTPELQRQVAEYAAAHLLGVPYHLSSGFLGPKAPDPEDLQFGLHCSYLAWYAWNRFGYDLDCDGGRLVTAFDLLHSDKLEVVQLYGMDPRIVLSQ